MIQLEVSALLWASNQPHYTARQREYAERESFFTTAVVFTNCAQKPPPLRSAIRLRERERMRERSGDGERVRASDKEMERESEKEGDGEREDERG